MKAGYEAGGLLGNLQRDSRILTPVGGRLTAGSGTSSQGEGGTLDLSKSAGQGRGPGWGGMEP